MQANPGNFALALLPAFARTCFIPASLMLSAVASTFIFP